MLDSVPRFCDEFRSKAFKLQHNARCRTDVLINLKAALEAAKDDNDLDLE